MTQPTQVDERQGPGDRRRQAPGGHPVGRAGIVASAVYLAGLAISLIYLLVVIWPQPAPSIKVADMADSTFAKAYWDCDPAIVARAKSDSTVREARCFSMAGTRFMLWDEQRLLLLVLVAGALGALLHALRSFSMYVGNRKLKESWVLMYALLPFTGSLIALVFYAVIRGGFFAPGTGVPATSPFAFAAMAFMVGLFSQVAAEKLKIVAESLFTKTQAAADSLSDRESNAVLRRAQRVASTNGGPQDAVDIEGSGFTEETRLEVNGRERQPELKGPTRLRLHLEPVEMAVLENGGELSVQLKNGDKESSAATVTVS